MVFSPFAEQCSLRTAPSTAVTGGGISLNMKPTPPKPLPPCIDKLPGVVWFPGHRKISWRYEIKPGFRLLTMLFITLIGRLRSILVCRGVARGSKLLQ
jgi:hypothetical protein